MPMARNTHLFESVAICFFKETTFCAPTTPSIVPFSGGLETGEAAGGAMGRGRSHSRSPELETGEADGGAMGRGRSHSRSPRRGVGGVRVPTTPLPLPRTGGLPAGLASAGIPTMLHPRHLGPAFAGVPTGPSTMPGVGHLEGNAINPGCPLSLDLQGTITPLLRVAYEFSLNAYTSADRASAASTEAIINAIRAGNRVSRAAMIIGAWNQQPTTPGGFT